MRIFLLTIITLSVMLLHDFCSPSKPKNEILAAEILNRIAKNENIFLDNYIIHGDLDFTEVKNNNFEAVGIIRHFISPSVTFKECIFMGKINSFRQGKDTTHCSFFEKNLSFIRCDFREEVNFKESYVAGAANFSASTFNKNSNFEGIQFAWKDIYFTESKFLGNARFQRAIFNGNANFLHVSFKETSSFQSAVFRADMQFGNTQFQGNSSFDNMKIAGICLFNYARFEKSTNFSNSHLQSRSEFMSCQFSAAAEFKETLFSLQSKFSESTFKEKVSFEKAIFSYGKPETRNVVLEKNASLNLTQSVYFSNQTLQINDFTHKSNP